MRNVLCETFCAKRFGQFFLEPHLNLGLGWPGLGWAGLGWAGLGPRLGLGWAGVAERLDWVLGWAGRGWAGLAGWMGHLET